MTASRSLPHVIFSAAVVLLGVSALLAFCGTNGQDSPVGQQQAPSAKRTTTGTQAKSPAAGAGQRSPRAQGRDVLAEFVKPPLPKSPDEKRILDVIADIERHWGLMRMNIMPQDGRLLRILVEATDAKKVVEVGTTFGYASLWLALGLRNTGGKLTTIEINIDRVDIAKKYFKQAGISDIIEVIEGDAHDEVEFLEGPIDMVFLDADKPGFHDYLKKLLPLLRPGGIIAAHNVHSHAAKMKDFLQAITNDPNLETVFLNPETGGLSVTLKKR